MPDLTLDQWEDHLGLPIVLLSGWNPATQQFDQLRVRDLPATAIAVILRWLNAHQPSQQ